ncbi:MAG: hypothetical protein AB1427_00730 [Thermodesulfobacteriota bacterium]
MSKRSKALEKNQRMFDFDFKQRVAEHLAEQAELLESISQTQEPRTMESYEEACIELAAACKRAQRRSGLSREQLVDRINDYFGWEEGSGRRLSIHMLNHHLSKPTEYPIPGALLFAVQHITGSLEPCRSLAEAEGGDVITQEDKQHLMLGKMEAAVWEMNRLKRELKSGGAR